MPEEPGQERPKRAAATGPPEWTVWTAGSHPGQRRFIFPGHLERKLQTTQKVGLQYGGAKINELTGPQQGAP